MIPHRFLFHLIAPVYRLFFNKQVSGYRKLLKEHFNEIGVASEGEVLEVGCGTGAFTRALSEFYPKVEGLDFAPGMVRAARKSGLSCFESDFFQFEDKKKYDLVWMAFVAHGWAPEKRQMLYRKAAEVSRSKVVFHDFNSRRNFWISAIEFLEGGTYFSFVRDPIAEMEKVFRKVRVIEVEKYVRWYICDV